jgi:D-proline reductase (dithiol) PrdB
MEHPELSRHCIPWTPFKRELSTARVCLVSSAGVRQKDQPAFDVEGDTTYRVISNGAALTYDDAHYDHECADADLNCIFPLDRLRELAADGLIKGVTDKHFSYGFSMNLRGLREQMFPGLLKDVESARPDIVLLTGG